MKKIICLAFILTFAAVSFAQTANEKVWIGKYAHENDVGKEYFMLEIFRDGDNLNGKYKETITAQTTAKLNLTVVVKGNTASFYANQCLALSKAEKDDGGSNKCGEQDGYQGGELLLKLKRVAKGSKLTFTAIGGLLTEQGFAGDIDFVKTKKFYYLF